MSYEGSCHCGAVTFSVTGDPPARAISCNCSHCRRKGLLLTFVPADQFILTGGEEALASYYFNRHAIEHQFCKICGSQAFGAGKGPDGSIMRAVNLRCVPSVDIDALTIEKVNGASH